MSVARQICILEYGVSLSCKRGFKRTQTKTGSPRGGAGGGGGDSRKRKRSQTRAQKFTLFFANTKSFYCQLSQRFSRRHRLLSAKGEFVRKLLEVKIMKT